MILNELEAAPEEEEAEPCVLFCKQSDYLTVGLSCAFIGALFLIVMGYVCIKGYMGKEAFSVALGKMLPSSHQPQSNV